VDFAPLPKGGRPKPLIKRLREIEAGVNDSGPPFRPTGLAGGLPAAGGVRMVPTGLLALLGATLPLRAGTACHPALQGKSPLAS
jgi:hypothetical protein